jgi:DNA-binding PadR family transcriptional regulator
MEEEYQEVLLKKWRAQLSRGMIEFLVLILLQKERYGWDILQLVRSMLPETEPQLADGTIYNILTRLNKRNLVVTRNEIVDGRMRRYFILAKEGKELLKLMLVDWDLLRTSVTEAQEIS